MFVAASNVFSTNTKKTKRTKRREKKIDKIFVIASEHIAIKNA